MTQQLALLACIFRGVAQTMRETNATTEQTITMTAEQLLVWTGAEEVGADVDRAIVAIGRVLSAAGVVPSLLIDALTTEADALVTEAGMR